MASQKFNEKKYDFVFSLFFMRIESAQKNQLEFNFLKNNWWWLNFKLRSLYYA